MKDLGDCSDVWWNIAIYVVSISQTRGTRTMRKSIMYLNTISQTRMYSYYDRLPCDNFFFWKTSTKNSLKHKMKNKNEPKRKWRECLGGFVVTSVLCILSERAIPLIPPLAGSVYSQPISILHRLLKLRAEFILFLFLKKGWWGVADNYSKPRRTINDEISQHLLDQACAHWKWLPQHELSLWLKSRGGLGRLAPITLLPSTAFYILSYLWYVGRRFEEWFSTLNARYKGIDQKSS